MCSHWMQSTSKELPANLCARVQCGLGLNNQRTCCGTRIIHIPYKRQWVLDTQRSLPPKYNDRQRVQPPTVDDTSYLLCLWLCLVNNSATDTTLTAKICCSANNNCRLQWFPCLHSLMLLLLLSSHHGFHVKTWHRVCCENSVSFFSLKFSILRNPSSSQHVLVSAFLSRKTGNEEKQWFHFPASLLVQGKQASTLNSVQLERSPRKNSAKNASVTKSFNWPCLTLATWFHVLCCLLSLIYEYFFLFRFVLISLVITISGKRCYFPSDSHNLCYCDLDTNNCLLDVLDYDWVMFY